MAENKIVTDNKAFFALFMGAVALGSAPILMRYSDEVSTSAGAFWRMFLASPILLAIWAVRIKQGRDRLPSLRMAFGAVIVGFFFAVDMFFWHWSVDATTVANATLLSNLAAVITAVFSYFILKTPLKKAFFIGLAMAIIGAGSLAAANLELRPEYLFGDFIATMTAFAYAAYILSVAKYRQNLSTLALMTISSFATAMFLLPAALIEEKAFIPVEIMGWAPLFGLAIVSHILGQGLVAYGLMAVPAALGSMTLLVQPVVAAIAAWLLFAEILAPMQLIGGALILFGVYWAKTRG